MLKGYKRLYEQLDRVLGNSLFFDHRENYYVKLLPCTLFSNHNSLLLSFLSPQGSARPRHFKFEGMWLFHDSFDNFLSNCWRNDGHLVEALPEVQNALFDCNRDVFGLVEKKKRIILARLGGTQKSPRYPQSYYLCSLEKELQGDLDQLLKLEEIK